MNRHYYVSDNLDELEQLEQELEASGIPVEQIHVLSEQDAELERHRVHPVPSVMKTDVFNLGWRGALVGLVLAVLVLLVAWLAGWTETRAGWGPFVLLALVLLGFSIWESGLIGIQQRNQHFRVVESSLQDGRHVLFVDVEPAEEALLAQVIGRHTGLLEAATASSLPHWLVAGQQRLNRLRKMI
ncbi:MAG TPA: magnesium transporter [Pseudomonas sp.]|jgi:hypothetical protein|nr:magnesium transporter [Pseudomonas sp.]